MAAPDPATTAAELTAVADTLGRSRERVAGLATAYLTTEREDLVTAIFEAERLLRNAERALERAVKLAR